MTGGACPDFAEARSAYVDGDLSERERQALLRHLSDCSCCRDEVAELRRLQSLLTRTDTGVGISDQLSARLASIAAAEAGTGRTRTGVARPAPRALALSATGAAMLLALLAGVGYVAAPTQAVAQPVEVPRSSVRAEFAAALAQVPMAGYPVAAALQVDPRRLVAEDVAVPEDPVMSGPQLSDPAVHRLLTRAQWASNRVRHSGVARVIAPRDDRTTAADVQIDFVPGTGSEVSVSNLAGRRLTDGLLATPPVSEIAGGDLLAALSAGYRVTGVSGGTLLGRRVSLVEVHRTDADQTDGDQTDADQTDADQTVAARWWIDEQTGLLIRQQTFDHARRLVLSAGYTELEVGAGAEQRAVQAYGNQPYGTEPPTLGSPLTTSAYTTSSAGELADQGWFCHDQLAGLALVRLRADAPAEPGVLHMIYTDGMSTVSVFQRRGSLRDGPAESTWDPGIGAYRDDAMLNTATWQSGDAVFTVATDGSPALRNRIVAALPHHQPNRRTTMERVQAGWSRIVDALVG